jgi:hypothetical protein
MNLIKSSLNPCHWETKGQRYIIMKVAVKDKNVNSENPLFRKIGKNPWMPYRSDVKDKQDILSAAKTYTYT